MRHRFVLSKITQVLILAMLTRHGLLWAAPDDSAQPDDNPTISNEDEALQLRLSDTLELIPAETPAPSSGENTEQNPSGIVVEGKPDPQNEVRETLLGDSPSPRLTSLQPYASATLMHDNNLLRLRVTDALGQPVADSVKQGTIGVKVDWKQGRHEIVLDASLNETRFSRFTTLDYQGVNLQSFWRWQLGHNVSGDIGYARNTSLNSFTEQHNLVKYLTTQQNKFFDGTWQAMPLLRLSGSLAKATYKSDSSTVYSNNSMSYVAGAYFTPATSNEIGIRGIRQVQNYPVLQSFAGISGGAVSIDNGFAQNQLLATVDWLYNGHVRANGQAGVVKRIHNQLAERDFSGKTLRGTVSWLASGKSKLELTAWDEIDGYDDQTTSYTQSKGFSLGPTWNPSGKMGVSAKWQHLKRDFLGDPLLKLFPGINSQVRQDTVDTANLFFSYQPTRTINITTGIQTERRSSSQSANDYSDMTFNLNMSIGL
jgi:exopolysaccharide biosynthesis operon protein EpsL